MGDTSYEYWRENIMDERLEYLDSEEKYAMYLEWKIEWENNITNKENA